MVRELVAIDMPASDAFVTTVKQIWDSGNAVLPIDQRLPEISRTKLLAEMGASAVVSADGSHTTLGHGRPVEIGDALVIATSGSTGQSKGVVHTHDSILFATKTTVARLRCTAEDHWLACISLAHVGGLSVVLRALHLGSRLTINSRADQATILAALDNGATMTSLVPTVLRSVDISRFKTVLIGGSNAPDNLPSNAISTYGLTETMGGVVYDGVPLDGVEIRLGEDSEIEIRSKSLLRCYRNGVDPKTNDGWLRTGDLGDLRDGGLKVLGRQDELINTGGFKVWPSTVENSIRQLEVVTDVFVAATPDKKWGSAVTAWVVLQPNVANLQLIVLRDHVQETLPDYCAPRKLFVVKQIPKSSLGKVQMTQLLKLSHESYEPHESHKSIE
ncbi:MAG: hypothetical protein CK542_01470 [Acidimicrobium sp.]|nr:MAG: hypothetical protein CK542_01470 [Acidimicrobium sp.]